MAFEVIHPPGGLDRLAADSYGLVGGIVGYEHIWRMAYMRGPEGIIVSRPSGSADAACSASSQPVRTRPALASRSARHRLVGARMQPSDITAEMERVRVDFHDLLDGAAGETELRAASNGTKWTNEQLLFHMLFGYLLVHNLLILVKVLSRLPGRCLQAIRGHSECRDPTLPCGQLCGVARRGSGAGLFGMGRLMGLVVRGLQRFLDRRTDDGLAGHALPGRRYRLPGLHDPARGVPLPDAALRAPPAPAHL